MKKKISLKNVLTINFILVATLPILVIGVLGLKNLSTNLEKEITNKNEIIVKALAGEFERFLQEPLSLLNQIAKVTQREIVSSDELNDYLSSLITEYHFFEMIRILDHEGIVRYLAPFNENFYGIDLSSQNYFSTGLQKKQYWSRTFFSPQSGRPTLTLSIPIESGMIVGHLDLSDLSQILDRVKIGQHGYAGLTDRDGSIIGHRNRQYVNERLNVQNLPVIAKGLSGKEGTFEYTFGGVEKIGSVAIIKPTGWLVVVTQPKNEAFAPVRKLKKLIFASLITGILIAVIAALLSLRKILKPLFLLTEDSKRIAAGDYDFKFDSAPYNEIDNLGNCFKTMINTVKKRENTLQVEILQRKKSEKVLQKSEGHLKKILELESFISELSTSFVNISLDSFDEEIEKWMKRIVEFMGLGRCGIALFSKENNNLVVTHSYTIPGYGTEKGVVLDEQLPWYFKWMTSGEEFLFENLPEDLPMEAVAEKDYCIQTGLRSVLAIPYLHEGELFGDLAFSTFNKFDWPDNRIKTLRLISGILMNALIRKKTLEILKENEERYRTIFENSIVGIFQTTPEGRFLDANPKLASILGYKSPEDLMNQVSDIKSQVYVDQEQRAQLIKSIQNHDLVDKQESIIYRKDKSKVIVSVTAHGVYGKDNKLHHLEGVVEDISALKQAEKEKNEFELQLQQTQKLESIGTLASGIAHDFNNILSSILGFASLIKMDLPKQSTELRNNIEQVITAGRRATDLVKHILMFSRHSDIEKKPLLVSPLIKETIKFLKASVPSSIEIRDESQDNDIAVMANATQFHQVVMNLGTNAVYAMKDAGGILSIRQEMVTLTNHDISDYGDMEPGDYLKLSISDTGNGIPAEAIDRIFDPFFTTKKRGEGTGMGLSVVHGIIKGMNGSVTVKNDPGKGARFNIKIPVYKKSIVNSSMTRTISPQKGELSVLFVDDDKSIIKMADKILKRIGYKMTIMSDSLKALELFKSDPNVFDIVVTDLDMPKMNGVEFSRQLLEIRGGIPIVLCTGFSGRLTQKGIQRIGIHKMVMKPVIMSSLVNIINDAVKKDGEQNLGNV